MTTLRLAMAPIHLSPALRIPRGFQICRPDIRRRGQNPAGFFRRSSTAAGQLPLEGYRVLDMTRVLAGVSASAFVLEHQGADEVAALLYPDLRRPWVSHPRVLMIGSRGRILRGRSAEVIKIEHPVRGDDTRAWGPPYAKYKAHSTREGPGESAYFLGVSSSWPQPRNSG